jgi:hypothetical protein
MIIRKAEIEQEVIDSRQKKLDELRSAASRVSIAVLEYRILAHNFDGQKVEQELKGLKDRSEYSNDWQDHGCAQAVSEAIRSLEYCLSKEAIQYILSVSTTSREFWDFVYDVANGYRSYIGTIAGQNYGIRSNYERALELYNYDKSKYPEPAEPKLLEIPELPIPLESVKQRLENWHSFGSYVESELKDFIFEKVDLASILLPQAANVQQGLTQLQLCHLSRCGILLVYQDRKTSYPFEHRIVLHPLARTILESQQTAKK